MAGSSVMPRVLVTGFAPYGGRGRNPAGEVAAALDGRTIAGAKVEGRQLPVAWRGLPNRLAALIDEVSPDIVVSLGLWPGEATIRLERFGLNLAHFEIPDNDGLRAADAAIAANGETALPASLPLRAIEAALHEAGIPAVLSSTAGTFLCNITLYTLMRLLASRAPAVRGGFIHVPYDEALLPQGSATPGMATRDMGRGIAVVVRASLETPVDTKLSAGAVH